MKKRTEISAIAAVVVAVCGLLVGAAGFLGRNSVTPEIVDRLFGITEHVRRQVAKRIDSGYSGSFLLTPTSANDHAVVLFYAEHGQPVRVWMNATALGAGTSKYAPIIDGHTWDEVLEGPAGLLDITTYLRFDRPPGNNLHTLRFKDVNLGGNTLLVECVVLVSNETVGSHD